jgi:hypothetical protein
VHRIPFASFSFRHRSREQKRQRQKFRIRKRSYCGSSAAGGWQHREKSALKTWHHVAGNMTERLNSRRDSAMFAGSPAGQFDRLEIA